MNEQSALRELKPCPFCGGRGVRLPRGAVGCIICAAEMPQTGAVDSDVAWNRRAESASDARPTVTWEHFHNGKWTPIPYRVYLDLGMQGDHQLRETFAAAPQPMASPDRATDEALRDAIGQALSDNLTSDDQTRHQRDWFDSREIDVLADAVMAVIAPRTMAAQPEAQVNAPRRQWSTPHYVGILAPAEGGSLFRMVLFRTDGHFDSGEGFWLSLGIAEDMRDALNAILPAATPAAAPVEQAAGDTLSECAWIEYQRQWPSEPKTIESSLRFAEFLAGARWAVTSNQAAAPVAQADDAAQADVDRLRAAGQYAETVATPTDSTRGDSERFATLLDQLIADSDHQGGTFVLNLRGQIIAAFDAARTHSAAADARVRQVVAEYRENLRAVGGFDDELTLIPARGVRNLLNAIDAAIASQRSEG